MQKFKYLLAALLSVAFVTLTLAQTKQEKKAAKLALVRTMVNEQNFNFIAQYANPQGGGHRFLTSDYNLRVTKDSLIAFLPYFGRAYFDVPYNPTDGGIKFTSTNFTCKVTEKKKGGWDVTIIPADVKYYNLINLYIGTSGSANAAFTITNKSFISFDGYLENKKL